MSSTKTVVAGVSLILIAAMVGGGLAAWWLFRNVDARLLLADQPATVALPEAIRVKANILDALDVLIEGDIATTVPINQTLQIPIQDTLRVMASMDSDVPIRMTVPIRDVIAIDQLVDVNTKVEVDVLGKTLTLPVRGQVPVKAMVPVKLDVPVDQMVRIRFTAPTDVRIKDAVSVPLKANISAVVPIHSEMKIPVKSALEADITVAQPFKAMIVHSDLQLPLRKLALGLARPEAGSAASGNAP